jgi:hypothetical protein
MERHLNEKWALVVGAVTMDMYNYSKKNYQFMGPTAITTSIADRVVYIFGTIHIQL